MTEGKKREGIEIVFLRANQNHLCTRGGLLDSEEGLATASTSDEEPEVATKCCTDE